MRRKTNLVFPLLMLGLCIHGFGQDPRNNPGAIFEAVRKGDLQQVIALLDSGVDVNCRGEHQYTPLIAAARYKRLDIAQALCERGADVNAAAEVDYNEEEWGYTPLIWAASNCHVDMAELLINNKAAVGQKGRGGYIPLVIAVRRNCLPLVRIFIAKGAGVDEADEENGDTALIRAVWGGYLDLAEYLIEKGADTGRRDQAGRDLLSIAASRGHFAGVRYFHEKGFSVNATNKRGEPPIFYAVRDDVESRYILEYLIEHGASVSARSAGGTTPLMVASYDGASTAAGILIANGATANDANSYKETPLQMACRGIRDPAIEDVTKWEATIKLLLDKGALVNTQDRDGKTPLMEAAGSKASQVIETLLKHGALVNTQDKKGWTALMHAAGGNQTAVIKLLAQRGADLNLRNGKGETALAVAKKYERTAQAYELLKSLGAKE